jgi:tripartite-type tricarboxylate transporter receptor subunit TctC
MRAVHNPTMILNRICLLLLTALFPLSVAAQPFPTKPVRLVVPQTPGGATDVFARLIGQKLSAKWGQPIVVENRAGAAGVVGSDAVAKSPADGYTLLVTYEGSQAVNQSLYAKLPFDSVKDFQPVATLAVTPFFFVVGPKVAARDLKEFIAVARAKPGSLTYASSGNGSINHLLAEMLKTEAGINVVHVPYKGIAPAMTDVIGGQVDAAFASVPSVIQHIRSGRLRALGVSRETRPRRRCPPLPKPAIPASTSIRGGGSLRRPGSRSRSSTRSTPTSPNCCGLPMSSRISRSRAPTR